MTTTFRQHMGAEGYTLVEMLMVLSIFALIAAIATPNLTRPSYHSQLQAIAQEVAAGMRLTRVSAIVKNTPMVMEVDAYQRTLRSPVVTIRHLPKDIEIELKVAEAERPAKSIGAFRFFPDGSSTGGDVVLGLRGMRVAICVHWLTGRSRVAESC